MNYKFHTKPYEHQRRVLPLLWKGHGGALFWDPGTAKTKPTLDYAAALHQAGKINRVLILCGINAIQVWPDQMDQHLSESVPWEVMIPEGTINEKAEQIEEYADQLEGSELSFIILNYEAMTKRDKAWRIMDAVKTYGLNMLILDESQKVKNATAKRSKAAHQLGRLAAYTVLLSGTPISKNYLDLYSQLKVLDPRIWRDPDQGDIMSWTRFRNRYGVWGGRTGYELRGYQNLDDLRARYLPHISTARKRDCLDLPKVTEVVIPVEMNAASRLAYDAFANEGMVVWRRHLIDGPIVLTKLLRLQQMTGGAVHDEVGEIVEFQKDKLTVLRGVVEDLRDAEQKVIVFARFKWEMNIITEALSPIGSIRGGVSHRGRKKAVQDFIASKKPEVMLIQIAAGESLDGFQTVCSHAIFYSTDYSWDHFKQAKGRLDRAGQQEPVTFWHLHMIASVDKLVYQSLMAKKNLEKRVMDDPDLLIVGN